MDGMGTDRADGVTTGERTTITPTFFSIEPKLLQMILTFPRFFALSRASTNRNNLGKIIAHDECVSILARCRSVTCSGNMAVDLSDVGNLVGDLIGLSGVCSACTATPVASWRKLSSSGQSRAAFFAWSSRRCGLHTQRGFGIVLWEGAVPSDVFLSRMK